MNFPAVFPLTPVFLLSLQGSYGVVKLAYNEDDEKYYVSSSEEFPLLYPVYTPP